MNSIRKRRLIWMVILGFSTAIAVFLILMALRQNINLYFTPTQISQNRLDEAKMGRRIRIGGMVEKGSLVRGKALQLEFVVTDFSHRLTIQYSGILPDLFKEGQGVVASGRLVGKDLFLADEILAKHDENYMPPGIKP